VKKVIALKAQVDIAPNTFAHCTCGWFEWILFSALIQHELKNLPGLNNLLPFDLSFLPSKRTMICTPILSLSLKLKTIVAQFNDFGGASLEVITLVKRWPVPLLRAVVLSLLRYAIHVGG